MRITDETPIVMLTVGQLREVIKSFIDEAIKSVVSVKENDIDSLLTTEEACEYLRISRPTIHRWKREGLIPHIRIGNNIRYRESDLRDVLQSKR
ncbi:MAG: helix-turn-helix domain-containing protein [Fermentimonas sp.]|nr:helix-turn-helix domain-containing protein [Fermentimonas sp.]